MRKKIMNYEKKLRILDDSELYYIFFGLIFLLLINSSMYQVNSNIRDGKINLYDRFTDVQ